MNNQSIKKITTTSILVAVAVVFDLIVRYTPGLNISMPNGGSPFGISMVPLVIIALIYGIPYGVIGGVIFGFVNFLLDGYGFHWASLLLDYVVAFGIIGLSGLFKGGLKSWKQTLFAIMLAGFLRYIIHGLSGVIIYADYTPPGKTPFFYSFILYNLPYMAATTFISAVILLLIRKKLNDILDESQML
jgi:thiamine transporter